MAASETIARNLDQQRSTSEADGGPGGPGGGGPGGGGPGGHGGLGGGPGPGGPGGPGSGGPGGGPGGPGGITGQSEPGDPLTGSENPWLDQAVDSAGIDFDDWDPELGAEANREQIIDVYRYYGDLFLEDPDLQWAGMANAIGPSFAAGFFDLATFRQAAGDLANVADSLPPGAFPLGSEGLEALANISAEELRYYETTFLRMQYDIFLDQAPMHEAYRSDGLDGIYELAGDNRLPPAMVEAWEMLDEGKRTGDQSLIAEANTIFLRREQEDIIDDYYLQMRNRFPSGPAFTYLMTMIGTPSIPGAEGFADAYPIDVSIETPGPERIGTPSRLGPISIPSVSVDNPLQGEVIVTTPFPDGNLANFEDRWRLIEENTLPAYLDLDPAEARDLAAADVGGRIDEQRLGFDDIIDTATNWDVDFDQ